MARTGGHERSCSATALNIPQVCLCSRIATANLHRTGLVFGAADWAQYFAHARASGPILRQA